MCRHNLFQLIQIVRRVSKCNAVKLEFSFVYLDLQENELEGVDWIDLARGREKWRAAFEHSDET